MTATQRCYLLLADLTLVLHFAFVAFVVGGLLLIWLGRLRHWNWVRNFWWRLAHLAAIGIVATEALTGTECPLTSWEDRLRLLAGGAERYEGSFIQHWLHAVMFCEADQRVFTIGYVLFFLAVVLSLWVVPPHPPNHSSKQPE